MIRSFLGSLVRSSLIAAAAAIICAGAQLEPIARPKLVLLVAVDQFRYDYLSRFRTEFTGGIKILLQKGAVLADANLEHYPTVTAIGHSTMLSGATPAVSGIMGNDWFDRKTGKQITSVSDENSQLLGGLPGAGSSPHRLLVSTLGDELKRAGLPAPKVFGLSLKDRSAILPVGRMADGAFWYSDDTGEFVSSTYYYKALPSWASAFNAEKHPDQFAGRVWISGREGQKERKLLAKPGPMLYSGVYASPFGNDLLALFAERVLKEEKLGQRGTTDLLSVSFSSNDSIGHSFGPDSEEAHVVSLNVDKAIGNLFQAVDKLVGLSNTLVVLTADHSVAPVPEVLAQQRMAGGRIKGNFFQPIQEELEKRYGPGKWLLATAGSSPYLNHELIASRQLDLREVRRVAAQAALRLPHVTRVYTWDELANGRVPADRFDARVIRSFNAQRSGDLEILLEPYWIRGSTIATHGSPYNYDTHIPLVFMGSAIRPGRYYQHASLNDLAPTVSAILDIEIPSGSEGRILGEIFRPAASVQTLKK